MSAAVGLQAQNTPLEDFGLPINDPDDILAVCGGDPSAGMPNFEASCAACHTLAEVEPHLAGPNLYALYGRTAGTAEGYVYSEAMLAAGVNGLVWGRDTLQPYLSDAQAVVPESIHPIMPEMVDVTYRTDLMTHVRLVTTPPPPRARRCRSPARGAGDGRGFCLWRIPRLGMRVLSCGRGHGDGRNPCDPRVRQRRDISPKTATARLK